MEGLDVRVTEANDQDQAPALEAGELTDGSVAGCLHPLVLPVVVTGSNAAITQTTICLMALWKRGASDAPAADITNAIKLGANAPNATEPDMKTNNIETRTEPWGLESLSVTYSDEQWTLEAGGAQMPHYKITETLLEVAITELVKSVTRDAIEDEAREWQNESALAPRRERGSQLNKSMKKINDSEHTTGAVAPAATCSASRELVFSRAVMDGNVSIRVTSDGGATAQDLTKTELEGIVSTLCQAGWPIFGQNDKPSHEEGGKEQQ